MLELATLAFSSAVNLLLGYMVFSKNPKSATNKRFLLLTCALVAWSIVNYMSVHPMWLSQIVWIRLVMFFAVFLCYAVYMTFTVFPDVVPQTEKLRQRERPALLASLVIMCLTITPAVFQDVRISETGSVSPVPNFGIILFIALVVTLLGGGLWNLLTKYHRANGRRRIQLRFVLIGLLATFGLILINNLLLVVVFDMSALVPFGSSFTLLFSATFAYAIVRHRLFDIKRAAARGLGYVLTVGFLGASYSFSVFGISSFIFGPNSVGPEIRAVDTGLALLMAFSFQPIKKFFDKLSNKVFYKDAYDPQQFIDQLNQALIAEVNLEKMLRSSMRIIVQNLKASQCTFVIYPTKYAPLRVLSSAKGKITIEQVEDLHLGNNAYNRKAVVADMLPRSHQTLSRKLKELNIDVLLRLSLGPTRRFRVVGDMLLGPKSSGDSYSSDDIRMLEIIDKELILAIENALRFEEIERFNETLQKQVEDATYKLRQSNAKLKKLDRTKDDFISMTSHQLRTPLSSIKGYVSLVMEGDAGEVTETQRKLLAQAFGSAQKMVYLVADLLNVSRLKTGKFVIERVPSDLSKVVTDEIAQLKEEFSARDLTVEYAKPKAFPVLPLDETKTRQVIMNFLDNAIYYTPKGGHVKVELEELPDRVEFRVIDNGIGVPKSERPHLFGKFYRAKNAQRARPDGTGLGLYMASKVVIAQGGAIIFESKEGQGSTFGFRFPKDMPEGQVPFPAQSHDE